VNFELCQLLFTSSYFLFSHRCARCGRQAVGERASEPDARVPPALLHSALPREAPPLRKDTPTPSGAEDRQREGRRKIPLFVARGEHAHECSRPGNDELSVCYAVRAHPP